MPVSWPSGTYTLEMYDSYGDGWQTNIGIIIIKTFNKILSFNFYRYWTAFIIKNLINGCKFIYIT